MKHSIKVRVMWATFISYTVIVGLLIYVWLSAYFDVWGLS